jgi:uncharacterized protein
VNPVSPDPEKLWELAWYKMMPFGKYKDWYLSDLPESYLIWFANKGYPPGKLGNLLREVYEIKLNGLESLLRDLRENRRTPLR